MRRIPLLLLLACNGADTDGTTDRPDAADGEIVVNDDGTSSPNSTLVDATCIDGQWAEQLPDPDAGINRAINGFDANDPAAFLIDVMEIRYPPGATLLEGGMASNAFGVSCIDAFTSPQQRGRAEGMLGAASTLVHECGHFYDIELGGFTTAAYVITDDLTITCGGGSYNDTPLRSRILADQWADLRPPCPTRGDFGCDSYADVYLSGDPDDNQFDSGDQGIDTVIEETVQYINSLATDWVLTDQRQAGAQISARDGILTFLWYLERYLHHMRTNNPRQYDAVVGKACWRESILTVWGRAWLYLDATRGIESLGIDDADIEALVRDEALLEEIQRIRDAEGC